MKEVGDTNILEMMAVALEAGLMVEVEAGLESELEPEVEAGLESELEPEVEAGLESEAEAGLEPEAEAGLKPEAEAGLEPELETEVYTVTMDTVVVAVEELLTEEAAWKYYVRYQIHNVNMTDHYR